MRAGELVFPSGLMALSRDGRVPAADDAAAFDAIGLAGQAQGALIHSYAEAVCKAVGVPMGNVVRAQYFLTDIRDFAGVAAAWSGPLRKAAAPLCHGASARTFAVERGRRHRRLLDLRGIIPPARSFAKTKAYNESMPSDLKWLSARRAEENGFGEPGLIERPALPP